MNIFGKCFMCAHLSLWILSLLDVVHVCMLRCLIQSCPTLCTPMDCSPPGFSVHGILQARILEWVATSFSKPPGQLLIIPKYFRPINQNL